MPTKSNPKCTSKAHCPIMKLYLHDEANVRRAGLTTILITNLHTGKTKYIGIAFKKSSQDKGVMLNFCPWCGSNLQKDFPKASKPKTTTSAQQETV